MKIKIIASVFALTTFTVLAQPSLPTTNSYIVPIANPYSGSWVYYTTNAASGLDFLGGASIASLNSASNSLASAIVTATTGLASQTYVNSTISAAISAATNGLASQTYVNGAITAATNGLVTAAITNGLATTAYADTVASAAQTAATAAAESYADTKASTLATNLQNMTWGTATNRPAGAAPATIYYYFTNGAPMFGIISTNQ